MLFIVTSSYNSEVSDHLPSFRTTSKKLAICSRRDMTEYKLVVVGGRFDRSFMFE